MRPHITKLNSFATRFIQSRTLGAPQSAPPHSGHQIAEGKWDGKMKKGTVFAEPGRPLQFEASEELDAPPTPEQKSAAVIATALKTYCKSARDLLASRFSFLAEIVPRHLRVPCDLSVFRCNDGVLVRYDATSEEKPRARSATLDGTLHDLAPPLTEFVVHFDEDQRNLQNAEKGPRIELRAVDATGNFTQMITVQPIILARSQLPEGFQLPSPPARPICVASIHNDFDIQLHGALETVDLFTNTGQGDDEHFIVHSRFHLPVGWLAIECYPLFDDTFWQEANAPIWAELDILGAAALRNLQQAQLNAIDPRSETRQRYALLLKEFEDLLQGPEEPVHQFLKRHPN